MAVVDWKVRPVEADRAARKCDRCGERRPDVRNGPNSGGSRLCNDCWFRTAPRRD